MNKKSNVYIITECPYVGILAAMVELSKILKKMGFVIYFLFPDNERNRYGEKQKENEAILREYGDIINIPLRRGYMQIAGDVTYLRKFFKGKESDIIISYTNYAGKISRILYALGVLKNVYHCPNCIQTKRFSGITKYIEWIFEKILAGCAKYYLSCGPSESYLLGKTFGIATNKLLLCPNFRTTVVSNKKDTEAEYSFIYVGRIVKDKGIERVLEIFSTLNMLNKIIFIGDGYELERLRKKYPEAHFTGRLENNKVLEYLKKAKYFVSASVMEGMPYSLIEAMSAGVVPLVSDIEGHKDLIIDNYNGFTFKNDLEFVNLIFKSELISDDHYNNMALFAKQSVQKLQEIGVRSIENHFKTY